MSTTGARTAYKKALGLLCEYCEENTNLTVSIDVSAYPVKFTLLPNKQLSIFDSPDNGENSEDGYLQITVGLATTVKSTMRFHVPAELLKRLIKLCEKAGNLYYHSFREAADETEEEGEAA